MNHLFHQHLLVKAWVRNAPKNEDDLNQWLSHLVSAIGMRVLMEPRSIYLDTIGNRGISGQVVIETSHIAIHVWDESDPAMLQMDVYSCRGFDSETVLKAIDEFGMVKFELMMVDRNDGFRVTEHRQG